MSGIDIFGWVVLVIMIATVVVVFVVLGTMPGKIARQREHPQAQAIQVAAWLALIFGFAAWPFVMVWAYLRPVARPLDQPEGETARRRIAELEAHVARLESAKEGGQTP
jgi:uncharacterized membrane protein YkvI